MNDNSSEGSPPSVIAVRRRLQARKLQYGELAGGGVGWKRASSALAQVVGLTPPDRRGTVLLYALPDGVREAFRFEKTLPGFKKKRGLTHIVFVVGITKW